LHILESDLFTDDHRFEQRGKLVPDAAVKKEFDQASSPSSDAAAGKDSGGGKIQTTRMPCFRKFLLTDYGATTPR